MLICIDAGHYLGTPGKRCLKSIDPGETREWVLNSRVADKVQKLLSGYDCDTMRVDDVTGKKEVTLYERVQAANKAKADIYLSIHHNAGINGGSGGGIVVYVCPGVDQETIELQKEVYNQTVLSTGLSGNRSNPLGVADFYVLVNTSMPAILGEFGFMDSTTDTPIILTEEYADKLSVGIVNALVKLYDLKEVDDMLTYEQWVEYMERYQKEQSEKPVDDWAKTNLELAKAAGITDGTRPLSNSTRQETALMCKKTLDLAVKQIKDSLSSAIKG